MCALFTVMYVDSYAINFLFPYKAIYNPWEFYEFGLPLPVFISVAAVLETIQVESIQLFSSYFRLVHMA